MNLLADIDQQVLIVDCSPGAKSDVCNCPVDKASEGYRAVVEAMGRCFPNIRLASRLETIVWAGYSRLQADINCMQASLIAISSPVLLQEGLAVELA